MSDNLPISPATPGGATIRTDELPGAVHAPVSKIMLGADGVDGPLVSASDPLPVSAAALPLPLGAATQATLASILSALGGTLAVDMASAPLPAGAATQTTLAAVLAALGGTLDVSAAALPLPQGAATQATLASILSALAGTIAVSAAALPLPAGAAAANQFPALISGRFPTIESFGIPAHDAKAYTYDGDGRVETIVFKSGGLAGSTVATLTLAYSGDNLASVVRS